MTAADGLVERLHSRGLRLTAQRRLVLEAVTALGHATPDDVHARVAAHGVNLSTVYRSLDLLEDLGLVTHTHLRHGASTFHAADAGDHAHLVCRACGEVDDARPELLAPLVERLAAERGFVADVRHLAVFGTCAECAASPDRAGTA